MFITVKAKTIPLNYELSGISPFMFKMYWSKPFSGTQSAVSLPLEDKRSHIFLKKACNIVVVLTEKLKAKLLLIIKCKVFLPHFAHAMPCHTYCEGFPDVLQSPSTLCVNINHIGIRDIKKTHSGQNPVA